MKLDIKDILKSARAKMTYEDKVFDLTFGEFIFSKFKKLVKGRVKEVSKGRLDVQKHIVSDIDKYSTVVAKCYRGFGKSTTFALMLPIYLALSNRKKYIVLVASSKKAASKLINNISLQLLHNPDLRDSYDYEVLKSNTTELTLLYNGEVIMFQGFGITSTDIRGLNTNGNRPDLVIADDLQNDKNVINKVLRDELHETFNNVLRGLSDREDRTFSILLLGTILHSDDIVSRISEESDTKVFNYPLITRFPGRMDIIEEKYRKSDKKEEFKPTVLELKSMALDNPELDKKEYIYRYFKNTSMFEQEFQNNPLDTDKALRFSEFTAVPKDLIYYGSLDPSMGKKRGDMQGVSIIGIDSENQKYVVYSKGFRVEPFSLLKIIEELHSKYNFVRFGIETNQFQEVYANELIKRSRESGSNLPIHKFHSSKAKSLRIERLGMELINNYVLVRETETQLKRELMSYPKGTDDILDSLASANFICNMYGFNEESLYTLDYEESRRRDEVSPFSRYESDFI